MSEIKEILIFLGRDKGDSDVSCSHLGKILEYLKKMKQAPLRPTINILGLIVGAHPRYIREGYMNGIEDSGIIKTINISNVEYFQWVGLKALTGVEFESDTDFLKRKHEESKNKNNGDSKNAKE